jgi:N utilization substance protein B
MPARRKSRQRALQVLFLCDARNLPVEQSIEQYYSTLYSAEVETETGQEPADPIDHDLFMETLARGTMAARDVLDGLIAERASNWRLERMPIVDRNLLRMAVFEMRDLGTPPAVVAKLNDAVAKALADPAIRRKLIDLAQDIFPPEQLTPQALSAFHQAEIDKWWPIIKAAGIKAE